MMYMNDGWLGVTSLTLGDMGGVDVMRGILEQRRDSRKNHLNGGNNNKVGNTLTKG